MLRKLGGYEQLVGQGRRSTSLRPERHLAALMFYCLGLKLWSSVHRPAVLASIPERRWRLCLGQPRQPSEDRGSATLQRQG